MMFHLELVVVRLTVLITGSCNRAMLYSLGLRLHSICC